MEAAPQPAAVGEGSPHAKNGQGARDGFCRRSGTWDGGGEIADLGDAGAPAAVDAVDAETEHIARNNRERSSSALSIYLAEKIKGSIQQVTERIHAIIIICIIGPVEGDWAAGGCVNRVNGNKTFAVVVVTCQCDRCRRC